MPRFLASSDFPVAPETLFRFHEQPGALERLLPPWQPVRVERFDGIHNGDRTVLRMGAGPATLRWVAEHQAYVPGREFTDVMLHGPFQRWRHVHRCLPAPASAGTARLEDEVRWELPGGAWSRRIAGGVVRENLERLFRFRHARTRADLRRQREQPAPAPSCIAITGATGLIGASLRAWLRSNGHTVLRVTRHPRGKGDVRWDPARAELDAHGLEGVDAVVHLAGESLAGLRWTPAKKRAIRESRVRGTHLLAAKLATLDPPPRVLLSGSATGFYGHRGVERCDESSSAGEGFLAEVCRAWEAAIEPLAGSATRIVHLRTGVVLSGHGGALVPMRIPFELGLGGPLGDGDAPFSWISLADVVYAISFLLDRGDVSGPVNLTSPAPVTQRELARTLGRVLRRPTVLRVPERALRLSLGEMAEEMLLGGALVEPRVLRSAGYRFEHPDLESALRFELGRMQGEGPRFEHRSEAPPAPGAPAQSL